MKVVILCGGQGTRLREETEYKPKPLVTIGGKPILWHILRHYSHFGFQEFVLCLGYKGQMIRDYFLRYLENNADLELDLAKNEWRTVGATKRPPWKITLVDTGENTMTGGRLLRVQKHVGKGPFCMTYGDAVCSVNLTSLVDFHRKHGKCATLTGVPPLPRFGELDVEGERVVRFNEKPAQQHGIINGGYFVLQPEIFQLLESDETIFERQPLEALAKRGDLHVFRHEGFWHCVDTYRDFRHLNDLWDQNDRPWVLWNET